jgi:hypothetical protein
MCAPQMPQQQMCAPQMGGFGGFGGGMFSIEL